MPGQKLIPWLLAGLYLVWSLRGAEQGPAAPDGGQHAVNGALIYDYLRSGLGTSPVEFAQTYLVHYPAVSIGYHPPLFHAIEAVLFAVFGVSPQVARLSVALLAALSVVLLYHLIRRTHGSAWFATLCVVVFCSLEMSQHAASDVMLELPSLFFSLLALRCMVDFQKGLSWRAALLFALWASAALWTKQHAVFLGLIPFLMVGTTGRWAELRRLPLWAGALIFAAACMLLIAFMRQLVGDEFTPTRQVANADWAQYVVIRNLLYYRWRLGRLFGYPTLVATGLACAVYLVQRWRDRDAVQQLALYAAWAVAVIPVPLVTWQHDERYVYGGFPAFIVILLDVVRRGAGRWMSPARAAWVTVAAALLLFGVRLGDHVTHNSGPNQVANYIWQQRPQRVLVCGRGDYKFIFTLRCLAGDQPSSVVLRGSKLPVETWQPERFEEFAHEYGVQYVIIGDSWKTRHLRNERPDRDPWLALVRQPTEHLRLVAKWPMTNTFDFMEGDVMVYQFTNPSPNPRTELKLWMGILKRSLEVNLSGASTPPDAGPLRHSETP